VHKIITPESSYQGSDEAKRAPSGSELFIYTLIAVVFYWNNDQGK